MLLLIKQTLETENGQLKQQVERNDIRIKQLEDEREQRTTADQKKLAEIEKRQEAVEQYARLNKIILKGSAFSYDPENVKTATINILAETLRLPKEQLKKSDYRIFGKDQTSIMMTVSDPHEKSAVFAAVRKIKPDNFSRPPKQHFFMNYVN